MRPSVLVTGGATRIGAEIVRRFSQSGFDVGIHYRSSADAAQALCEEIGGGITCRIDFSREDATREGIDALVDEGFDPDVIVFSASQFAPDRLADFSSDRFHEAMQVNFLSITQVLRALLDRTAGAKTVIIVSDQKIENLNPDFFSYTASKIFSSHLVEIMALDGDFAGTNFYGIAPGLTLPSHDQTDDEFEQSSTMNLRRRRTHPHDIAQACVFLAENLLADGTTIFVDSGQHLLDHARDVMFLVREETKH